MRARIKLLGRFAVSVDGVDVDDSMWLRKHAAAVVKLLAITPGHRLHRERVIDALWPGAGLEDAAPRLHKAAHYARRALLDRSSLVLAGEAVALFPGGEVEVDAIRFQRLAERAISEQSPELAGTAVDSYHGELLPSDIYEPWSEQYREQLRLLQLKVLRLAGRWEALAVADPADETAHLRVMEALAAQGDPRSALRQFERLERGLRRELGVSPGPTAIRLRDRLLAAARVSTATTAERPTEADSAPESVGRGNELERLGDLLQKSGSGRGQVLFLVGAAGMGKTSTLTWLEQRATARGMRLGWGAAAEIEGAWPYAPVMEALSDLCRRHPALLDGLGDEFREEIERAMAGREMSWTGQSSHQKLFVAVAELLRLAAAGHGAVVVIDDAHAADDSTLRLVHYLARGSFNDRVLIVLAHRPSPPAALAQMRSGLLARHTATIIELGPLSRRDAVILARQHAPTAGGDLIDAIRDASGGMPFAIIEMAEAARAGSATVSGASLLPPALPAAVTEALRAVAVLGNTFDTDEFISVIGAPEESAFALLDQSVGQRLLVRTDSGYMFRHALVRDALLDGMSQSRSRELHRGAAVALQSRNASPARIGHHLVQAGETPAAVHWMLRAAETEAALGAYRDALSTIESVAPQAQGEDLARLLALRADLLLACADPSAVDAYREALGAAIEDTERARLRTRLARAAVFNNDLDTAAAALDGLRLSESTDAAGLLLGRGLLALHRGDLEAAGAAASEARRRLALERDADWKLFDLISLQGLVAHNRGEWFQRLRTELRNGIGNPDLAVGIFDSHLCVAEYLLYGPTPYDEVLELAAELRRTAERSGVLRAVAFATALRGEAALLKGDLTLAVEELKDAVALHHDIGSNAGEAHCLQRLAEVHLARGERTEAMGLLHRSLVLARWSNIALHLLQRVYGSMIAAAPDAAAARAMVDRAESALGFDDRCTFCNVMLAVPAALACADVGDIDDARRHLADAEKSAQMWEGTAWQASLIEVRAHIARADGDVETSRRLLREAAELFEASGQPLDASRCRSTGAGAVSSASRNDEAQRLTS